MPVAAVMFLDFNLYTDLQNVYRGEILLPFCFSSCSFAASKASDHSGKPVLVVKVAIILKLRRFAHQPKNSCKKGICTIKGMKFSVSCFNIVVVV